MRVGSSGLRSQVVVNAKAVDTRGTSGLKSGNRGVNQIYGGYSHDGHKRVRSRCETRPASPLRFVIHPQYLPTSLFGSQGLGTRPMEVTRRLATRSSISHSWRESDSPRLHPVPAGTRLILASDLVKHVRTRTKGRTLSSRRASYLVYS